MLPDKHCLSHDMCLYQMMMTLLVLNDVAYDVESSSKSKITPKSETMGKLINRIPGSCLLISAWECMLNRSASLAKSTRVLGNLISKDTCLIFSIFCV